MSESQGSLFLLRMLSVSCSLGPLEERLIKEKKKVKERYLFTSERLGFRNWEQSDFSVFAAMNADPEVMEHFPKPLTMAETAEFIDRLRRHYEKHGFNYFASEILESGELIGFIGLAHQNYQSKFTPAVDIGWRLKKSAWGKGYATEGAKRCLSYAFNTLYLDRIISVYTEKNTKSENVMIKIGMKKIGSFDHPKLADYPELQHCYCYEINKQR